MLRASRSNRTTSESRGKWEGARPSGRLLAFPALVPRPVPHPHELEVRETVPRGETKKGNVPALFG